MGRLHANFVAINAHPHVADIYTLTTKIFVIKSVRKYLYKLYK